MTMAVYFIQCMASGFIKIGWTDKRVRYRLRELASNGGPAGEFRVLGVIDTDETQLEYVIHRMFRHARARYALPAFKAECFRPVPELLSFAAAMPPHEDTGFAYTAKRRPRPDESQPIHEAFGTEEARP